MKIIEEQFEQVKHCFPRQRGNVKMSNLEFLNAVLYVVENGCRWRKLPREFGNWHTVYRRMSRRSKCRWSKSGVLNKVFTELQKLSVIKVKIEHVSIDSTGIKVHPDAAGALKTRAAIQRR
jgi:transposase